jgi:hypothetical protein
MKHSMNKNMRTLVILTTLIVVTILVALWATSTVWLARFPWEPWGPRQRPPYEIPGDIEFFYTAQTIVSSINVVLSVFLLLTYISIYRKTLSEFTIGLIIFSMVLLLHAVTSIPLVHWIFGFREFGLGPFAMLPNLFTLGALVVLIYLSIKY